MELSIRKLKTFEDRVEDPLESLDLFRYPSQPEALLGHFQDSFAEFEAIQDISNITDDIVRLEFVDGLEKDAEFTF
jgi:isopenicillin N synthase-like dioxygenase